jgi:KDO2-lipid IV(A) lauroyltransferase
MAFIKKRKRDAVYLLAESLFFLINRLPRSLALFFGSWLGLAAWQLLPRDRHRIDRHLRLAFGPDCPGPRREVIGRSFFVNTGRNLVDIARLGKHFDSEFRSIVQVEGLEHFDRCYREGKGVIGVTGHIGNFELLAGFVAAQGYEVAVIGRELYDERLDRLLTDNRRALGLTNIATTDSPRRLVKWLKEGKSLGVLIDTDSVRVRSMFVPSFGRLSNTPVGQTIMGLKLGAAFVPMACLRTAGDRYRLVIKPKIEIQPSGDFRRDIYEVTCRCTEALEEIIRAYPDQWIWLHNRWHTRPED